MHAFAAADADLRSFYLSAESERTVSGNISVQGANGWYTFPFTNVGISRDVAHYKDEFVQFDRTLYHSKPLYVRLPPGETIERWWVSDATASGETTFGWDAQGHVICSDVPDVPGAPPSKGLAPRVNASDDLSQLPGSADVVIAPQHMDAPAGFTSCATPFVDAEVTHARSPDWPEGIRISRSASSIVEVAVAADGKIADAWIYQPSGLPELDFAALKSAKLSSYKGGISLCGPASGAYLFHATFMP
jgi:hypothetical protein